MNANNIINKILEEETIFLDQFNEKKHFSKEVNSKSKFLHSDETSIYFLFYSTLSIVTSLIIFYTLISFFPEIEISKISDSFIGLSSLILSIFSGCFTTFVIEKTISRWYFNKLYKNRNKNNIIKKLFKHIFYDKQISDEIHNMLKVYLSDDDYINLVKKGITYKNTSLFLNEIIQNKKIIANKREVFLTPEEIKKYQYKY